MIVRTQEEILQRIEDRKDDDFFGFETGDYVDFLTFENAKPFLKEGVTKSQWEKKYNRPLTDPVKEIKDYMEFAWDKANNCRGLSAGRSLNHMVAWLWLAGEDEFLKEHNNLEDYEFYGKPQLIAICEKYNIDWKQYDNGVRTNYG